MNWDSKRLTICSILGAELIASANPGCSLQIKKHLQLKGKEITLMHPMELLDYSIRGSEAK
jgi:glycolate oxidase iron-sulfur subunit